MPDKISILIIDDDINILEPLKTLLECHFQDVKTAGSGDEAFLILKNFIPDIILLDITMPRMDGFEICKILKSNPETKAVPVLFLTGVGAELSMKFQSLMVGAVDYISKPYDHDELIEKIRKHLKQEV